MKSQFDRELDDLEERLASGLISDIEYNHELHEMERDYSAARDEAMFHAAENEGRNW